MPRAGITDLLAALGRKIGRGVRDWDDRSVAEDKARLLEPVCATARLDDESLRCMRAGAARARSAYAAAGRCGARSGWRRGPPIARAARSTARSSSSPAPRAQIVCSTSWTSAPG
jgi:hypothetical protein